MMDPIQKITRKAVSVNELVAVATHDEMKVGDKLQLKLADGSSIQIELQKIDRAYSTVGLFVKMEGDCPVVDARLAE